MMQLLLYQINCPPVWTWRVWGLDRVPVQSFSCFAGIFLCFTSGVFEVLEGDLFQDDFTMAFYSFGGVNDQCGVTSWAVQETGMLPLLSYDNCGWIVSFFHPKENDSSPRYCSLKLVYVCIIYVCMVILLC